MQLTALILQMMTTPGQVLQNLTFHISFQEIQHKILNSSAKKKVSLLKVPSCSTEEVLLCRRKTTWAQGLG